LNHDSWVIQIYLCPCKLLILGRRHNAAEGSPAVSGSGLLPTRFHYRPAIPIPGWADPAIPKGYRVRCARFCATEIEGQTTLVFRPSPSLTPGIHPRAWLPQPPKGPRLTRFSISARYSRTSAGMMTLSIQDFSAGSSFLPRPEDRAEPRCRSSVASSPALVFLISTQLLESSLPRRSVEQTRGGKRGNAFHSVS
jgi:hypothetical protein